MTRSRQTSVLLFALLSIIGLLLYSYQYAYDRLTWWMEVAPVFMVIPVLLITHQRYPLTPLLYLFIFLHAIVLIVGGTYTYARVPIGFDIAHLLGIERNPYDKIGHFFQGFVPALATREILIRGRYINGNKMLTFLTVCVVLAISASYELIEWAAATIMGQDADAFLGTQGYVWDTQTDMLMALIGAVAAIITCSSLQARQLAKLPPLQHNR